MQSVRNLTKPSVLGGPASRTSVRAGVRATRFKQRSNKQSIRFTRHAFRVAGETPGLTKVGSIPITWSRHLPATPGSVTIIKDCAGRSFASFVVEIQGGDLSPGLGQNVGIDLGLASLTVTSDGEKIAPPTFLPSAQKRIRRLQRSLSRKVRGSNNRFKVRFRLAKAQAKVSDSRLDLLHKLSTRLIRENQAICIEHLNVDAQNSPGVQSRPVRTVMEGNLPLGANISGLLNLWAQ